MKTALLCISLIASIFCYSQVGIQTLNPKSTLDINGNVSYKVVSLNGGPAGSATAIDDGYYINLLPDASNDEFYLPDATLVPGRKYLLRNISATVDAKIYSARGDFYAGNSNGVSPSPILMKTNDSTKTLVFISDGSNWTYGPFGW